MLGVHATRHQFIVRATPDASSGKQHNAMFHVTELVVAVMIGRKGFPSGQNWNGLRSWVVLRGAVGARKTRL